MTPTKFTMLAIAASVILTAGTATVSAATATWSTANLPIKMYIFGHTYLEDKNHPIGKLRVYLKKDGKEIVSSITNESGLYELVTDNRSEYMNLCAESAGNVAWSAKISLCETVSVFQKLWQVVDGVEIRNAEHDFYIGKDGSNLNERYINEIRNAPEDSAFDEYQHTLNENAEVAKTQSGELALQKEKEEMKAKYRMPANTEMTGPLKNVQIVGTLKANPGMDKDKITVRVYSHEGKMLKERPLWALFDFRIDLLPKDGPVFLHPLVLEISSTETVQKDGKAVPVYEKYYASVTGEKNIFTASLDPYSGKYDRKTEERPATAPWILPIVLLALAAGIAARRRQKRKSKVVNDI